MDLRGIGPEDISWCQEVFDDAFTDLHRRHGMPEADPTPDADWLRPVLTHLFSTDPDGSLGAFVDDAPVAFATTIRRDGYWFLSFLFVRPGRQGEGIGRALLDALAPTDPEVVRATVVESFQPVSTGLYASFGMVPRSIKYWLTGVQRPSSLPRLPDEIRRTPATPDDRADIDVLDRAVLGFRRPMDHRWWIGAGTPAWVFRREVDMIAYAYVDDGFIGPVLADREETLCAVVSDLVGSADEPAGMSVNLCADSGALFRMLVDAGAKIDQSAGYRFLYCASDGPLPASYIHHSDWLP